jgi:hypothetical protein
MYFKLILVSESGDSDATMDTASTSGDSIRDVIMLSTGQSSESDVEDEESTDFSSSESEISDEEGTEFAEKEVSGFTHK